MADTPVTHVRLDVYPDGGLARLRVNGEVALDALAAATVRWLDSLPEQHGLAVLTEGAGMSRDEAGKLLSARPFVRLDAVPAPVVAALLAS